MKYLITGAWQDAGNYIPVIEKQGHTVIFHKWEEDPLPQGALEAEAVICNGLFLYHPISAFSALRVVQLTSAGFDRMPMDYARTHGIRVFNARGVYSIPMAEYALCGVLALYKDLPVFLDRQKERRWEKRRSLKELWGSTILIYGCGSVGTACAVRFQAMGCRVLGADKAAVQRPGFDAVTDPESADLLLGQADVVLCALPLEKGTKHFFSRERFAAMKEWAVFVNLSRGEVCDSASLTEALLSGRLGGAVLDVFEKEPLQEDSPLWNMEHVIITPHNSFAGTGNSQRLRQVIQSNLGLQL